MGLLGEKSKCYQCVIPPTSNFFLESQSTYIFDSLLTFLILSKLDLRLTELVSLPMAAVVAQAVEQLHSVRVGRVQIPGQTWLFSV